MENNWDLELEIVLNKVPPPPLREKKGLKDVLTEYYIYIYNSGSRTYSGNQENFRRFCGKPLLLLLLSSIPRGNSESGLDWCDSLSPYPKVHLGWSEWTKSKRFATRKRTIFSLMINSKLNCKWKSADSASVKHVKILPSPPPTPPSSNMYL